MFLDEGAKGIVRVILDVLEDFFHRSSLFLVGVEDDINAVGEVLVIAIERHSLDVLLSIHQNADLGVAGLTERKVGHAAAKLNSSVPLEAAVLGVPNLQTGGVYALRIDEGRLKGLAAVRADVVLDRVDLSEVVDVLMLRPGRAENL